VEFVRRREGKVEATIRATLARPDGKSLEIGFRSVIEDVQMAASNPIAKELQLDKQGH
jgi:hypothetical protein